MSEQRDYNNVPDWLDDEGVVEWNKALCEARVDIERVTEDYSETLNRLQLDLYENRARINERLIKALARIEEDAQKRQQRDTEQAQPEATDANDA